MFWQVQIPLPRKGTETVQLVELPLTPSVVQIPLPRKGTETLLAGSYEPRQDYCSNSITPKGDGNEHRFCFETLGSQRFKFHYPERGRKHCLISTSLFEAFRFKFHYPERGRKHRHIDVLAICSGKFKFHYPERGRKLSVFWPQSHGIEAGSNSITPKGDGNQHLGAQGYSVCSVQIPLPRKGTETINVSEIGDLIYHRVQIPLPRKGTETHALTFKAPNARRVQIPLPRKGTET